MEPSTAEDRRYSADELAALANVPRRTLRYYIQLGLVERPIGETRAAYYTWQHLRQLLEVRRLTEQGFSLEQILALQEQQGTGPDASSPPAAARPGTVSVRSHVHLAAGVDLVIDPGLAQLNPEQLRRFAREALLAFERVATRNKNDKES